MIPQRANKTMVLGFVIILSGCILLLHQMNLIPQNISGILISWQMLLILIGLFNVLFWQGRIAGYILILIGLFFLLPEFFILPDHYRKMFWPIIVMAIGFLILARYFGRRNEKGGPAKVMQGNEYIDEVNIFSGSEKQISIRNFKGGRITSVFGGSEINVRDCEPAPGEHYIEIFCLFGGTEVTVPSDWHIINKVSSVFGGLSDKRKQLSDKESDPEITFVFTGTVIFGGVEIKRN
jgi:predicted membrane protein